MNQEQAPSQLPAPCIIDTGIIVNKEDMRRLLSHLTRVEYTHILGGEVKSKGKGCVLEIFNDPNQSTLIANQALYLNVQSFDYLQLNSQDPNCFQLIQDNRQLNLIPLSSPIQEEIATPDLEISRLEAMVVQVLSAKWDVQLDDDDCPF